MQIPLDKRKHLVAGLVVGLAVAAVLLGLHLALKVASPALADQLVPLAGLPLMAIVGAGVAGVVKEWCDLADNDLAQLQGRAPPHEVSELDAAFTLVGGALAALPVLLALLGLH